MINAINKNILHEYYKKLKFDYAKYISWLNDEPIDAMAYFGSSSNIDIRKKDDWNSKGREIYNYEKLQFHSSTIYDILQKIGFNKFLVQHEYKTWNWLPIQIIKGRDIDNKKKYFKEKIPNLNMSEFDGAFYIENIDFQEFIISFIDYPYRLKYQDIDCISLDGDLVVKITHHLTIDIFTFDCKLFKSIEEMIKNVGIKFTVSS